MRRLVVIGMVLVLALGLGLASAALAKTATAPKAVCFNISDGAADLSLVIKMQGTVEKAIGPVKFFNINGEFFWYGVSVPMVGTGHLDGTKFHFSLVGSTAIALGGLINTYTVEADWDMSNSGSQILYYRRISTSGENDIQYSFVPFDCASDVIPYTASGLGVPGLDP